MYCVKTPRIIAMRTIWMLLFCWSHDNPNDKNGNETNKSTNNSGDRYYCRSWSVYTRRRSRSLGLLSMDFCCGVSTVYGWPLSTLLPKVRSSITISSELVAEDVVSETLLDTSWASLIGHYKTQYRDSVCRQHRPNGILPPVRERSGR